jgi:hypothetical protein
VDRQHEERREENRETGRTRREERTVRNESNKAHSITRSTHALASLASVSLVSALYVLSLFSLSSLSLLSLFSLALCVFMGTEDLQQSLHTRVTLCKFGDHRGKPTNTFHAPCVVRGLMLEEHSNLYRKDTWRHMGRERRRGGGDRVGVCGEREREVGDLLGLVRRGSWLRTAMLLSTDAACRSRRDDLKY